MFALFTVRIHLRNKRAKRGEGILTSILFPAPTMGGFISRATKKLPTPSAVVEPNATHAGIQTVRQSPLWTGPEWELSEWTVGLMAANPMAKAAGAPDYEDHEQKIRDFCRYYRGHIARMFCTFCHKETADCHCIAGYDIRKIPAPPWLMVHQKKMPDGYMAPMKILDVQRGNSERHMKLSLGSAEWRIEFGKHGMCTGAFADIPRGAVYPRDHSEAGNFWTSLQSATHTLWTSQFSRPAFRRRILDLFASYFAEPGIGRILLSYLEFPSGTIALEFGSTDLKTELQNARTWIINSSASFAKI